MLFNGSRGGIIAKTTRLFRQGITIFIGALFVIGLIGAYIYPGVISLIMTVADGITSGALNSISAAQTVGDGAANAAPFGIGVVLTLAYWVAVSVWIDHRHLQTKDARILAQIAAGALYLGAFILYVRLFIA